MSRIGKKPVSVPAGVKISLDPKACVIVAEGTKGKLSFTYRSEVNVAWDEAEKSITCTITDAQRKKGLNRALWGTTRARIQNLVKGVHEGYSKRLEIIGVGWNAKDQGKILQLNVGFCHPIDMTPPPGVEFKVDKSFITISGPDKHMVGQFAANIRANRPPEPYKGKGIRYVGEYVIRKQGKVFGT